MPEESAILYVWRQSGETDTFALMQGVVLVWTGSWYVLILNVKP